jgi:hypothetical protein
MGLLSRSVPTTPGRALVAPGSATLAGHGEEDNVNNFSANARVRCRVGLEPLGPEGRGELQRVDARLPNWLRIVLYSAGTNHDIGPELPAELEVPVLMEAGTTRIASLDVDATAAELAGFRKLARREWLETEAPLAPVRGAVKLPGAALRGARGLLTSWRGAFADTPAGPEEIEQMRRTAVMQRHYWAKHPEERDKYRASVLDIRDEMVRGTKAGVRAETDLEAWIMTHEVSEILTPEEAAALRRDAGLP